MVSDARTQTKTYLDTYLRNAQLTKDDGSTQVTFITQFKDPDYPLSRVFKNPKNVDLIFSIGIPNSTPMMDPLTKAPYGYEEHVPIITSCIDKSGITGTKLLWKAVAEMRYIAETYPEGSQRTIKSQNPAPVNLGSTIIHQQKHIMNYRRDTT